MTPGAKVRSIDALDTFRSSLLVYLTRSRAVLEDVAQEIVRARIWLQTDRQVHWKRQIRLLSTAVSQAEQELVTARLAGDAGAIMERKKALAKARENLRHAEAGLERVRRWLLRYPTDVEARGALPQRLQNVLANDGGRAVHFLEKAAAILADYADRGTGSAAAPAVPASAVSPGTPGAADASSGGLERGGTATVPSPAAQKVL